MKIDRRRALGLLGAGLPAGAAAASAAAQAKAVFLHGVASGDPLTDRVVLWTRVSGQSGPVEVRWTVAEDEGFSRVRARGRAATDAGRDHTVKVDAAGLEPGRDYFYRFEAAGAVSPVGRTRTAAAAGSGEPVVLAVASCSLHPNGYFNAYRAIAGLERLDAVVHLGDYIYEYGAAARDYGMANGAKLNRIPEPPHEIVTLADYRQRHAQYKRDPDLQAAHARAPWIVVLDDHETANDSWEDGAQNHNEGEGAWADRKAAALKAYFEWLPIREPAGGDLARGLIRSFRFGDVASLHMIETRLTARDLPLEYETDLAGPDGQPDIPGFLRKLTDPNRRLMGEAQLKTVERDLAEAVAAGVAWQVVGNQVIMARVAGPDVVKAFGREPVEAAIAQLEGRQRTTLERMARLFSAGLPMNLDAWDGYPAERERLYQAFRRAGARPLVLTGDSHSSWVNSLHAADGVRVAAEFGATAITSPAPGYSRSLPGMDVTGVIVEQNPEVLHLGLERGFTLLTLEKDAANADLVGVSTIESQAFETAVTKRFRVRREGQGMGEVEAV